MKREAYWRSLGKGARRLEVAPFLNDRRVRRAIESDPDARPTDAEFWKTARLTLPVAKQTITIRLDADLLAWLRQQKGYQTRINAVLRAYMEASQSPGSRG